MQRKLPLVPNDANARKKKVQLNTKEALVKLLRWHFGYADFRGSQLDAIQAVLSGIDCFCLMPTGGGKSMCYQIPALAKTGIVLVVCPLIALMENQVMALKEKGIAAEFLSSTKTADAKNKIHEDLASGKPSTRLLYVTPELIATPGFMSKLTKIYARGLLSLIAIDEAHCISSWGHDFRPSYRKLSSLRSHLPDVPILALTATAVPKVQKDVVESLQMQNPLILKSSFNRPNIYYEVRYKDLLDDTYADLSNALKSKGNVCGIVYCLERSMCDELAAHLSQCGISCAAYHAGLNNKMRTSVLDDWISSKIKVVVATVAFGMGIDRKDVRIVCHFNVPKSMEAFYQESGRAGRDQLPSTSLLYYGIDDRKKMEFILRNSGSKKVQSSSSQEDSSRISLTAFNQMVEYCEGSGCRRKRILESFGEKVTASLCGKTCDSCRCPNMVARNLEDLTAACALRQRNGSSRVFITSSTDAVDGEQLSEFWNRDEEEIRSDEDISDSDDGHEVVNNLTRSKLQSRLGLNEKLALLQRAEENFYRNENSDKQSDKVDKNAISDTMRGASRQRLQNALKQAQKRLDNFKIEMETSAFLLEDECYKKYGKAGKSFYYSQVASTVRWLTTASSTDLTDRLCAMNASSSTNVLSEAENPLTVTPPPAPDLCAKEDNSNEQSVNAISETSPCVAPMKSSVNIELPQIPSFSEFVNSRKAKGDQSNDTKRHASRVEKKMRIRCQRVRFFRPTTPLSVGFAHTRLPGEKLGASLQVATMADQGGGRGGVPDARSEQDAEKNAEHDPIHPVQQSSSQPHQQTLQQPVQSILQPPLGDQHILQPLQPTQSVMQSLQRYTREPIHPAFQRILQSHPDNPNVQTIILQHPDVVQSILQSSQRVRSYAQSILQSSQRHESDEVHIPVLDTGGVLVAPSPASSQSAVSLAVTAPPQPNRGSSVRPRSPSIECVMQVVTIAAQGGGHGGVLAACREQDAEHDPIHPFQQSTSQHVQHIPQQPVQRIVQLSQLDQHILQLLQPLWRILQHNQSILQRPTRGIMNPALQRILQSHPDNPVVYSIVFTLHNPIIRTLLRTLQRPDQVQSILQSSSSQAIHPDVLNYLHCPNVQRILLILHHPVIVRSILQSSQPVHRDVLRIAQHPEVQSILNSSEHVGPYAQYILQSSQQHENDEAHIPVQDTRGVLVAPSGNIDFSGQPSRRSSVCPRSPSIGRCERCERIAEILEGVLHHDDGSIAPEPGTELYDRIQQAYELARSVAETVESRNQRRSTESETGTSSTQ